MAKNNLVTGNPEEIKARIELLESFFVRFGKEFKDALKEVKISVEEFGWADWYLYKLDTARTNELVSIPQDGSCICRVKLDGSASLKINSPQAESLDLETIPRVYGIPFQRLFVTNTAQSGKELLLLVGKGSFNVESVSMAPMDIQAQYSALIDSTTTVLSASGTYTTTSWYDLSNYGHVTVRAFSDVMGTLYLQWSDDGSTLHYEQKEETTPITMSSGSTMYYAIIKTDRSNGRYCKFYYVNGIAIQTSFSLYGFARAIG